MGGGSGGGKKGSKDEKTRNGETDRKANHAGFHSEKKGLRGMKRNRAKERKEKNSRKSGIPGTTRTLRQTSRYKLRTSGSRIPPELFVSTRLKGKELKRRMAASNPKKFFRASLTRTANSEERGAG